MLFKIENERDYAIRKGKVLEKFQEEFWYKHRDNVLFRNVYESLIRDADPYEIIERLIEINREAYEKLQEIMPYVSPNYALKDNPLKK